MAERAGLFDDNDLDLSGFTTKKPANSAEPPPEAVRRVSEGAQFKSREPATPKKARRRRTGRNLQLNLKVDAVTRESLYEITDQQGYTCLGETLEKAIAALRRELAQR